MIVLWTRAEPSQGLVVYIPSLSGSIFTEDIFACTAFVAEKAALGTASASNAATKVLAAIFIIDHLKPGLLPTIASRQGAGKAGLNKTTRVFIVPVGFCKLLRELTAGEFHF
jgi:hypothetical protein